MHKIKVLIWNILRGGRNRVPQIKAALFKHNADIVFLSEFRNNDDGDTINQHLKNSGYKNTYSPNTEKPSDNTVFLASKLPFSIKKNPAKLGEHTPRFALAKFDAFMFIGVHINDQKNPAYSYLSGLPQKLVKGSTIIAGDFNTGVNYIDGEGYRFKRSSKFGALLSNGWTDAWRTMHPLDSEFTWYSQKNNGFRIDHILLSVGLRQNIKSADFSHNERESKTSDHSILTSIVKIDPKKNEA